MTQNLAYASLVVDFAVIGFAPAMDDIYEKTDVLDGLPITFYVGQGRTCETLVRSARTGVHIACFCFWWRNDRY